MGMFNISERKEKNLFEKMAKYGVLEGDLEEKFIRASGSGGQKVNKTSVCVYLKHLPTGTEVKSQSDRSQSMNRYLARRRLVDKIEEQVLGRKSAAEQKREKIRRQKRKRSQRAKDKMLQQKRIVSEKKKLRSTPELEEG